jgi:hypothetical protein
MAWTAPMTFVAGNALTAAQLNTHLRDNLLETMPGKATTPGGFFVVDGTAPIRLEERVVTSAALMEPDSTATTTFTDLSTGTVGPSVTVNTGTRAMTWFGARMYNGTAAAQCVMTYEVSGATTSAAADSSALIIDGLNTAQRQQQGMYDFLTTLTSGINTFTCKYRAGGAGTAYFFWRRIGVWPL